MLPTIALIIAVVIIAILLYAMTRPDTFRIERSATINAPPEKIFPFINEFPNWVHWSPWEKLDPELKRTRTGPPAGKGSIYEWEGNKKVGKGRMEIMESSLAKILIKLDFLKPFEAHNTAEFQLAPGNGATQVTWTMRGSKPFMMKLVGVFMNMDNIIGKDFEKGLAALKAAAEK